MKGNHDWRNGWGPCTRCGVNNEQIEDGLASPWCDYFTPSPVGYIGMWAHWIAIMVFCGIPFVALVAGTNGPAQWLLSFVAIFGALVVAELRAGLFDTLLETF